MPIQSKYIERSCNKSLSAESLMRADVRTHESVTLRMSISHA